MPSFINQIPSLSTTRSIKTSKQHLNLMNFVGILGKFVILKQSKIMMSCIMENKVYMENNDVMYYVFAICVIVIVEAISFVLYIWNIVDRKLWFYLTFVR